MTRDSLLYYAEPFLKSKVGLAAIALMLVCFFLKNHPVTKKIFLLFAFFAARKWLYISLAAGLLIRLAWLNLAPYQTYTEWNMSAALNESDVINIQALENAQSKGILNADGTPSGRRPMGYIYFLSFFYKILGPHPAIPVILQTLLTLLFITLYYLLLARHFPPGIAGFSGLILAFYPPLVISTNIVLDEYLFLPLWFLGMLVFLNNFPALSWKTTFFLGIIWGLSTVVRTQSIVMPAVVFLTGLILRQPVKKWSLKCLVMGLLLLSVNIPIAIRNYQAWGVPVYYTATGGFIYSMLNPFTRGDITRVPEKGEPYYSEAFHQAKNEGEEHIFGLRMARKWVLENPWDFLHLCGQKILWFFSPDNSEWALSLHADTENRNGVKLPSAFKKWVSLADKTIQTFFIFSFFALLVLTLTKIIKIQNRPAPVFLLITFLSWITLHAISNPYVKYRLIIDILIFPLTFFLFYLNLKSPDCHQNDFVHKKNN